MQLNPFLTYGVSLGGMHVLVSPCVSFSMLFPHFKNCSIYHDKDTYSTLNLNAPVFNSLKIFSN